MTHKTEKSFLKETEAMSNDELMNALRDVEFCDSETGTYFRAASVCDESTGVVVILEVAE